MEVSKNVGPMIGGLLGALFGTLTWVITLSVIGSAGMISLINSALTGVCNSGWMLASFFNPSGGILTIFIVLGLFILVIVGSLAGAVVGYMSTGKKK